MKAYEDLKEMLCREVEEIAHKGELSAGDLETAHKLTDTIKNILKIECIEEEGYSMDGGWRASGTYSRRGHSYDDNSYGGGNSYANRGKHYVRGHYSRDGYSMDEGRMEIAEQIKEMMNDQSLSQEDKQVLRRAMEQLKR